ncbi:MAG: methylmalonyl Co-A mutase-associated GTPase MeaB [Lishizhenia sp.]
MNEEQLNNWLEKRKSHKDSLNLDALKKGVLAGDIAVLSAAITLLESTRTKDKSIANELINSILSSTGKSIRIGITGVPGVGKSTFIESFGLSLANLGKKVAVLAIDPTSEKSRGSILGDKTRMEKLSVHENVFIRPSAAGESLGGVARKTREAIFLCEAAGFDVILIETVGVGQSETVVHSMVDFFLLLMLSGAGDELQGIKRGIMEMADALVITKADGENIKDANRARQEYKNALHLFPPNKNEWIPKTTTCSAYTNTNIDKVWEIVESFENHTKTKGWFNKNRNIQDKYWMNETLKELLMNDFYNHPEIKKQLKVEEEKIITGLKSSFKSAEDLFEQYKKK